MSSCCWRWLSLHGSLFFIIRYSNCTRVDSGLDCLSEKALANQFDRTRGSLQNGIWSANSRKATRCSSRSEFAINREKHLKEFLMSRTGESSSSFCVSLEPCHGSRALFPDWWPLSRPFSWVHTISRSHFSTRRHCISRIPPLFRVPRTIFGSELVRLSRRNRKTRVWSGSPGNWAIDELSGDISWQFRVLHPQRTPIPRILS
jgi:hypothetical protein